MGSAPVTECEAASPAFKRNKVQEHPLKNLELSGCSPFDAYTENILTSNVKIIESVFWVPQNYITFLQVIWQKSL